MADQELELDVLRDVLEEINVIGQLARDDKAFTAAYQALRAGDAKTYQAVLERLHLLPRCHLVCEWLRSKECIFLCLELCGLPKPMDQAPNPRVLADAIVHLTTQENQVRTLVAALEKRDAAAFQRIVEQYKLGPLCHFFCHWVCVVRYRLICRWVCGVEQAARPDLVRELVSAGQALRHLLASKNAFDQAVAASNAGDAVKLGSIFGGPDIVQYCPFLCEWFCSWRCTLACLTLCRQFPLEPIKEEIAEALAFAKAIQPLATNLPAVQRLTAAVGAGDARTYAAIVAELKLQPFCIQLCHWICGLRCRWFCIRVCPPQDTIPLFTHVGQYHVAPVYGDFQADGTTTAGGYAFTRQIPLIGILPGWESASTYEYRFRIAKYPGPGPVQDVLGAMIRPTVIGQLEYKFWDVTLPGPDKWTTGSTEYYASNPGATHAIPQQFGPPLAVSVNTDVQAGGWIKVPHENNLTNGGGGRFIPQGGLALLDTTQYTNESFDLTLPAPGLQAGNPVPAGIPPHSEKPVYKIFFEARKQGTVAVLSSNNLDKIAFSNTAYKYVRHAEWAGGPVTTRDVCSLDIAELIAPGATGCDEQHDHVHALYTCYHPYLGSVLLWLQGPGIPVGTGIPPSPVPPAPFSFVPALAAGETASGAVGHDFDISGLKPCAFILWMSATVNLTQGYGLISDATDWDLIAFCKKH
jgi:hypothetical protein